MSKLINIIVFCFILLGFIVFIIWCMAGAGYSQELAQDKWFGDDKIIHCLGGYTLNSTLQLTLPISTTRAIVLTQLASLLWETKDSFCSDGFSYRDHIAVTIGQLIWVAIRGINTKRIKPYDIRLKSVQLRR